jgi:uncharacterized protein YjfI (DUF2170 family)
VRYVTARAWSRAEPRLVVPRAVLDGNGDQLVIEMGAQGTERIVVSFQKDRVVINTVICHRQQ